jgi:hypothetical protein
MSTMQDEGTKTEKSTTTAPGIDLHDVAELAMLNFREYASSRPETIALWCLGIGFVLGWKLKPW